MEDDYLSVVSLPERLSKYHEQYYNSAVEDCDVSVTSAPSRLERASIHASLILSESFNIMVMTNSSSFYDDDMPPPSPPLTPPSPQSEYTSFVNASPSPPHHQALTLCLTKSQDSVESLYLRPLPKPAMALSTLSLPTQRLTFSPIPEEQGEEFTVEDYLDSIASVDDLSLGSSGTDSSLGVGINLHTEQTLLQPDLIMDAPTGITLVFDRMLDCLDPPGSKHLCRDSHYHERLPHKGHGSHSIDDPSTTSIDGMQIEDSSSFPSASNSSFNRFVDVSLANILEKQSGDEEPQFLFPCWDDEGFDSPIPAAESPQKRRPRGRSKTRRPPPSPIRVPSDLKLFEEEEETKEVDETSESSVSTPPPPLSPHPFTRQRADTSDCIMYVSDESNDDLGGDLDPVYSNEAQFDEEKECDNHDNDDDSLFNLLRGLDFDDPLFDENDDLFKLDRTQTTDGDCTLSYSSFTY
ncbi:MAG: hypothetical protein SGILL_001304 [Bacillariaceae sp.]